jgi:hypothetical protein
MGWQAVSLHLAFLVSGEGDGMTRGASRAVLVALIVVIAGLHVAATPAFGQGESTCRYTPNTPETRGRAVHGTATWTCDLPSDTQTVILVRLLRDGTTFANRRYVFRGSFSENLSTDDDFPKDCHQYQVATSGESIHSTPGPKERVDYPAEVSEAVKLGAFCTSRDQDPPPRLDA